MQPDILPIKLPNGFTFDMIKVEGGVFWMGDNNGQFDDEKPAHQVELDTFYIGKYPVTQGLWKAVMGEGNNPSFFKGDDRPVEQVSWLDIAGDEQEGKEGFLHLLNRKVTPGSLLGMRFRLPTEAEWEFAARGGMKSKGFLYAGSDQLKNVGWFWDIKHRETKDVGQKQSNELGLYDMSGNLREWCWDWWDDKFYEKCKSQGIVKNPLGPEQGASRVLRGGGWHLSAGHCRATYRHGDTPEATGFGAEPQLKRKTFQVCKSGYLQSPL